MRRANPPVGWQSITLQLPHSTTVCAWLKTVVICDFETKSSQVLPKDTRNSCETYRKELRR